MNSKALKYVNIICLVLSAVMLLGILFVFKPCGQKDDGTWMNCHYAGLYVAWIAAAMTLLSVCRFFIHNSAAQTAVNIITAALAILAAVIPGNIVHLCMMKTMRCQAVMKPAVMIFGILIAASSVINIFIVCKRK